LHRRDSLVALFWPELDQEHARAALRQALHGLRHALGDGVLVTRGDEDIGLDAERIRCDVVEFERAAVAGQLADALDLYRGDLLEGFFIRGAPEFEQWLEDERARLKTVALRSATVLGEQSEARAGLPESAQWARRALRIAPLDEPSLRRLMKTLDRLGDRSGHWTRTKHSRSGLLRSSKPTLRRRRVRSPAPCASVWRPCPPTPSCRQ